MLKQIESLNEAAEIVRNARVRTVGASAAIWQKVDRIYQYINRQVKEAMTSLENA